MYLSIHMPVYLSVCPIYLSISVPHLFIHVLLVCPFVPPCTRFAPLHAHPSVHACLSLFCPSLCLFMPPYVCLMHSICPSCALSFLSHTASLCLPVIFPSCLSTCSHFPVSPPRSLFSSHPDLSVFSPIPGAWSHLGTFVLAVPSAWFTLPSGSHMAARHFLQIFAQTAVPSR